MVPAAPYLPPHLVDRLGRGLPPLPSADSFDAALLVADIAGFTSLTERLQARGRSGAEEITAIVRTAFRPALAAIRDERGSVVGFGGDSVLALFTGTRSVARASRAATRIRDAFAARGEVATSAGPASLEISQVIHHGCVQGMHLGLPARRVYVVGGAAVRHLARLEESSRPGRVRLSTAAARQLAREGGADEDRVPPGRGGARTSAVSLYVPAHVDAALREGFAGRFRQAVILFLELRGSGERCFHPFAAALLQSLQRYDGALVGTDISPHGTRWLCAFGAFRAHEDDVDRAALLAGEVAARAGRAVRGGMHAGVVANLRMGDAERASLEVMGDVTNTAARVCARAGWGEVLLTADVARRLHRLGTSARGAAHLKGKEATVELHALAGGRAGDASRAGGPARPATSPLCGRARELASLRRALGALRRGRGAAWLVVGEAGIGKSRLVAELERHARAARLPVLIGRSSPLSDGGPPAMLQLANGLAGLAATDASGAAAWRSALSSRASRYELDHLAVVLGLEGEMDSRGLERSAVVASAARGLRSLAVARAGRGMVCILEDAHWASEVEVALAGALLAATADAPLLVVATSRDPLAVPAGTRTMTLAGLPPYCSLQLLRSRVSGMPASIAAPLVARADGNPFFLEELADHVGEVMRELVAELPESIESLVAARMDRLPASSREVVEVGAVLGKSFAPALLSRVLGRDVADDLLRLRREELVVAEEGETSRLAFKHALVRDAAYGGMLIARRRTLHRRVGRSLSASGEPASSAALLAHHARAGGDVARARGHLREAGRVAAASHALSDAERHWRDYLELCRRPGRASIEVRLELVRRVLGHVGRYAEARAEAQAALSEARALGLRRLALDALFALAVAEGSLGDLDAREALVDEGFALARTLRDAALEAKALAARATMAQDRGRLADARRDEVRVAALHRRLGNELDLAISLGNLAVLAMKEGSMHEARDLLLEALEIRRRHGDRVGEGRVLGNLGSNHHNSGRLDEAQSAYEQALAIHRETGDRRFEGRILANLASLLLDRGRLDDAEAMLEAARRVCREIGDFRGEGIALSNLCNVRQIQGRPANAIAFLEQARELHDAHGETRLAGWWLRNLSVMYLDMGRIEASWDALWAARDRARSSGDRRLAALVLISESTIVRFDVGDGEEAERIGRHAVAELEALGNVTSVASAWCPVGFALLLQGKSAAEAIAASRRCGHQPLDSRATMESLERSEQDFLAGRPLLRGQSPADVARALRARLRARGVRPVAPERAGADRPLPRVTARV